jgi:hypothetical protein
MKVLAKHYIIENADIGENTVIRDYVTYLDAKLVKTVKSLLL